MIKVLHYIQTVGMGKDNNALSYTEILIRSTENEAESYVVKQNELGSNWLSFRSHFLKKLREMQPDMVHIHGSWNYFTALAEKLARQKGYFTVVSPHGTLTPGMTDEPDFWKKKMPRILIYQSDMIHKTKYLIATDEKEEEDLKILGWKKRITKVQASSDDTQNDKVTCEQLMAAYSKVIDTNYVLRITDEEKKLVNKCLYASLWKYDKLPENMSFTDEDKTAIEGFSMRRINLYIYDNHITDLFYKGAKRLNLTLAPALDVEAIPRFKQKKQKRGRWEKNIEKISSIISDLIEGINIKVDYTEAGSISLQTYGDIYSAIRFNNYDEDAFNTQIKKKYVKKATAKLMTLLHDYFELEIGFMPILPK